MQTDALFYELFMVEPESVFQLMQLKLEGKYSFESVTVKTTEKRLDGLCRRVDGTGPNVFVEIQGYDDPKIYWRVLREVATYYEQHDDTNPFIVIVLFLDKQDDPANFPFSRTTPPNQLLRGYLPDCLNAIEQPGILMVLQPLVATKAEVFEHAQIWKQCLQELPFPEEKISKLVELLEFAIRQRLPNLSEQEIRTMLQLTPLEETRAGKELMFASEQRGQAKGRQEGEKRGVTKGEVIGEIRALQKVLKQPVTPIKHLVPRSVKTLKVMLEELEAELAKVL